MQMKVLFVSEYFYPKGIGGGERSAYKLGKALVKKGVEVHILTSYFKGIKVRENLDGMNIWRFLEPSLQDASGSMIENLKRLNRFENSVTDFTTYLNNILNFDVIHCKNSSSACVVALKKKINAKFVIHINSYVLLCPKGTMVYRDRDMNRRRECKHDCNLINYNICMSDSEQVGNKNVPKKKINNLFFKIGLRLRHKYYFSLLKRFDEYIALSNQVKNNMIRLGFPEKKITVIYPILEVD